MIASLRVTQEALKWHTYIVIHGNQGQVPLDFVAVKCQTHVISQLLQIWIQTFEIVKTNRKRRKVGRKGNWGTEVLAGGKEEEQKTGGQGEYGGKTMC